MHYQANRNGPVFAELKGLVMKTTGLVEVLRSALLPLKERLLLAVIYGSMARGGEKRGSDVDLLVVGNVTFGDIVSALEPAQGLLRREVNPTVYPPDEFRARVESHHHFLKSVFSLEHIYLTGRDHELAGLAEKRLAEGTSTGQPGDRPTFERSGPGSF